MTAIEITTIANPIVAALVGAGQCGSSGRESRPCAKPERSAKMPAMPKPCGLSADAGYCSEDNLASSI